MTTTNALAPAVLVALTLFAPQTAQAANGDPAGAARIYEEVLVTGTRTRQRSIAEFMSPIDAIAGDRVAEQGETNLDMLLRNVVPSFNISATTGDAAVLVRPTNLRGLAPDHTLVLVNGRRRPEAPSSFGPGSVSRTVPKARTFPPSPPSPCGKWKCCATAHRHNTAPTPSPA